MVACRYYKNFLFWCSIQHLTCLLRTLMRYRVEHSTRDSIILCTHVLFFMYLIDEACHKSELWVIQSENTLTAGSNCRNGKLKPSCVFLALKSILCSKLQQVFRSKMNISMARFKAWSWGVPTLTYCSSESTKKKKNDTRRWLISHHVSRVTSWSDNHGPHILAENQLWDQNNDY